MSTDISIWSSHPIKLPDVLPQSSLWKEYPSKLGAEHQYEGDGWLVGVCDPEPRDADALVIAVMPDAKYLIALGLEPIGASAAGYRMLEIVTRAITRACDGLWVDPWGNLSRHDEGTFDDGTFV